MGQIVIQAAAAVAGYYIGGPTGAQIGWMIGGAIGAETKKVQGAQQSLMDLKITGTEYGQPIPYVRGAARIAGQMWWNTDRRPVTTTTTESSDGKGGGGTETTTSTTTYDMDCLIGLTDNEIVGIARIWNNGKLMWTSSSGATAGSIAASEASNAWTDLRIYTGSMTQLPDPTYEAAIGAANAIAYRGRAYVFIEGLKLGQGGQVPNLTFEVVADGGVTPDAPTIGAATGGIAQATVTFTAPGEDGGLTITGYTVTATATGTTTPVVSTGTGAASPIVVTGLANGTTYDFTVHATNAAGNGPESGIATATTKAQQFATFDPAHNGGAVLSGGDLIAEFTNAGGAGKTLLLNMLTDSGKHYCEIGVLVDTGGAGNAEVGLVSLNSPAQSLSNYIGHNEHGYGLIADARIIHSGSAGGYGAAWGAVNRIGILWDGDAHTLGFRIGGVDYGTAFASASPGIGEVGSTWTFAVQGIGTPAITFTLNSGQAGWVDAPPAGYEGLYVWV